MVSAERSGRLAGLSLRRLSLFRATHVRAGANPFSEASERLPAFRPVNPRVELAVSSLAFAYGTATLHSSGGRPRGLLEAGAHCAEPLRIALGIGIGGVKLNRLLQIEAVVAAGTSGLGSRWVRECFAQDSIQLDCGQVVVAKRAALLPSTPIRDRGSCALEDVDGLLGARFGAIVPLPLQVNETQVQVSFGKSSVFLDCLLEPLLCEVSATCLVVHYTFIVL